MTEEKEEEEEDEDKENDEAAVVMAKNAMARVRVVRKVVDVIVDETGCRL